VTLALTAPATTQPWWTCPTWCPGTPDACFGGDTFAGLTIGRIHTGTLLDLTTDGEDGNSPQRVRIILERCDTPDGPGTTTRRLHVGATNRPQHLDQADIDAHLRGIDRGVRDSLLAHYMAGTWAEQTATLTDGQCATLAAALGGI
jgi:hypothetical protein